MAAHHTEPIVSVDDLPLQFSVKYLGEQPAKGLWGIKHTRKPVDILVGIAKNLPENGTLPLVTVEVSTEGLKLFQYSPKQKPSKLPVKIFKVDAISYGVQDLVYTRVFCMIVVDDTDQRNGLPFHCHGFVCDSRAQARRLTYALAAAFQEYGNKVKEGKDHNTNHVKKKFAIDLRTPEELGQDSDDETEA
ncbi:hypothetical protein RI129_002115 [Pyrocoelia pectoralis]|uniref:PID domain-containing protein n=1 Tax=Pyrocoelia pectoralis TaxID=417401 RepID=A0AAN7VLR0_9COLE